MNELNKPSSIYMKAKEIRDLIDFISHLGLDEVNIETEEFKLSVKKNSWNKHEVKNHISDQITETPHHINVESSHLMATNNVRDVTNATEITTGKDNYTSIKSPMIGTFYQASNPQSEPFVKVGDMVSVGQTVCIIEAMKLFNEIESEVSGKVLKILAENASPVEYDQPLFLIDPS
jgi:acetyl-CoA carboxylase biotin carboxyl carrier protein